MENQIEDQAKKYNTSLRAQSRINWGRKQVDGIPTDEQLSTGALMRIADTLEGNPVNDYTTIELIRVGKRLLDQRRRNPLRDQFHFTFEQPAQKSILSITIFGITLSIHKQ